MRDKVQTKLNVALASAIFSLALLLYPCPAYAADAENWASLEGWLSTINGKLGYIYADTTNIYDILGDIEDELESIRLNGSVWTDSDIDALLNPNLNALPGGETSIRGYIRQIYYNFLNFDDAVDQYLYTLQTESEYQSDVLDSINSKWASWANAGYPVDTSVNVTVDSADFTIDSQTKNAIINTSSKSGLIYDYIVDEFTIYIDDMYSDLYTIRTDLKAWKNGGYTVNTGLNLTPLLQELVNIETVINALVNDPTKVFTVNTNLNLTPLLQELVNIETAINGLDSETYTVDTGLDLSPIVRELTNIETTLETGTISVDTEWSAIDITGMMLTQNSILDTLEDFYEYQQNYVNSNLSSIFSELQLILGRWDAWRDDGYTVDTGLTIPSLSTVHSKLDSLISAWSTWRNSGYDVDTGLNLNPLLQELVNIESAIDGLTFPTFDDTHILLGISSLGESVDAIYSWLLLDSAADVIGDFDFDDLADKSELLLANASNIAPFAGYALIAVMLQIWAGSGVLNEPQLNFNFDFFQTGDIVTIDLSWLNEGLPLVHFFMISMLILCLVNSSARIIEMEATA